MPAGSGGYGALEANYGLGLDQIVGATLANCDGKLVSADEEMLEAIRGGGGCIGVITDLTIKTYPLKGVLGGVIVYKTEDLPTTLQQFSRGYRALEQEGLPSALGIQQALCQLRRTLDDDGLIFLQCCAAESPCPRTTTARMFDWVSRCDQRLDARVHCTAGEV